MKGARQARLAVLTTGRQDYSILRSTLCLLRDDRRFDLLLWVGGMHLAPRHGLTVDAIIGDRLPITARLAFLAEPEDPVADAGRALAMVAAALASGKPDALLLLGDRTETCAAALAATMHGTPIVHLHGGEESEGAIDNSLRHAITKMSHLHLVSHESHARRVRQMGEPDASVRVVGAAGLDNLYRDDLPDRAALERRLGGLLTDPIVVVTLHPTTLGGSAEEEANELAAAMEGLVATWVITQPNADRGGDVIRQMWTRWAEGRPRTFVVDALGERNFWGLLKIASAMLGNSSAGIIEGPAAGLPVINVGDRQAGRLRTPHVVDVPFERDSIAQALGGALMPKRRQELAGVTSPFPSGAAAPRIIEALSAWDIPITPRKRFVDRPTTEGVAQ